MAREEDLDAKLTARFGLPAFRPWQREAIEALLFGPKRVLVVAPTGGGKSLTYQFPATELQGTSIVVSPLIALMEDQVRSLEARGIRATYLSSSLGADERRARMRGLREGLFQVAYVTPERLAFPDFVEELRRLRPPLVAIDEAHCISQWGHDFRPDYLRLGDVLVALGAPRVLACTATATPIVRSEILERLRMPASTHVVLRGFARPNLHLAAEEVDGVRARRKVIATTLKEALGSVSRPRGGAIIYAATRKGAEEYGATLSQEGWRTAVYHAGLEAEVRSQVSARFADRQVDVMVATNAFGMGIDRPDIRCVIHANAPSSIEAYYQEVGRAGRDGEAALGLLLCGAADLGLRRRLLEHGTTSSGGPPDPDRLATQWKLFLDLMRYVEAGSCRHDFILRYFGDEQEILGGCGHCDVCERLEAEGGGARTTSPEDALVVRKALAGIARANRKVGMGGVAEMLIGATSPRVTRAGLSELSTFGLLRGRSERWTLALLRRLVTAGLVQVTSGTYPMPYLTPLGRETMTDKKEVRVLPPESDAPEARRHRIDKAESKGKKQDKPVLAGGDADLFERLRTARIELARTAKVPPYVVAHDRTLMAIATQRPRTLRDLAGIHGMGPARIEAYGEHFLQALEGSARGA